MDQQRLLATGLSFAIYLAVMVLTRLTRWRLIAPLEQRQRVWNVLRYGLTLLLGGLLIFIWADVVRAARIMAGAIAVALVLASKELILCLHGWWVKMASDAFHIGDRIHVGSFKGDVLDYGLLTTTLMGVGQGEHDELRSGAVVTIPNSLYLPDPIYNLTHTLQYKWEQIVVPVMKGEDWKVAEKRLLAAAQGETASYVDEACAQADQLKDRLAFQPIQTEARVLVEPKGKDELQLILRVPLPVRRARIVRDRILRHYLSQDGDLAAP